MSSALTECQGVGEACFNLGLMHAYAQGCAQDYEAAYQWFTLAMWRGNQAAADNREALAPKMQPEQITAGRQRAKEFAVEKNWRKD